MKDKLIKLFPGVAALDMESYSLAVLANDKPYVVIKGASDNGNNKVVVYKGSDIDWCINTKVPIAFQGTLQGFENWLKNNK